MTSRAAFVKRSTPILGGVATAAVLALTLAGCATGSAPGTDTESTTIPETTISEPTAAPEDDGRLEANVIVLDARYDEGAGTIEVSSIVTSHIGDGTCYIEATSAVGDTVSAEVEALPDAQSTVCPTTTLEGVTAGEWSVTVTFDSDEAYGASEATPAEAL
ncbi:hypothetical protein [Gulosibacter chungangensis]|uniref:Uncharacterized protein n=1 Tax=Gulosibacter chungangensis TaxID=979746 RepID=A0A7J5BFQ6_9MICO|nr:hypothetical protein [Gulosibacter chungangensis]KAB1644742.1 hypothetical protein F8O05_00200 [Gulosibacter chungangensis]